MIGNRVSAKKRNKKRRRRTMSCGPGHCAKKCLIIIDQLSLALSRIFDIFERDIPANTVCFQRRAVFWEVKTNHWNWDWTQTGNFFLALRNEGSSTIFGLLNENEPFYWVPKWCLYQSYQANQRQDGKFVIQEGFCRKRNDLVQAFFFLTEAS